MSFDAGEHFKKMKYEYEVVFSTPEGKRVLEDIKASGMVSRRIFNESQAVMAHNEGRRNLAIHIVEMATPQTDKPKTSEATK
jgi:hypothetical protein